MKEEIFRQIPFWDDLSEKEKRQMARSASFYTFAEGAWIGGFQDACMGMVHILQGAVRVYITSAEGREITLFHINEGENCILSAACAIGGLSLDVQLMAEQETGLLAVHAGTVQDLMSENLSVRCYVYELAAHRYSAVVDVLQTIIFDPFDRRLASQLLSVYDRTGSRQIRMTQEALAKEVNSAREVVARMLRRFSKKGWITLGRGVITLGDMEALKKLAGR